VQNDERRIKFLRAGDLLDGTANDVDLVPAVAADSSPVLNAAAWVIRP